MTDQKKPRVNSEGEKELQKAQEQFDAFDTSVKELTMDRMNAAPKQELEPQTKLSQLEIAKSNDIYLKPRRSIGCRDKFNEKFRDHYNYDKEYVQFIAENKEIIGESLEIWTRPYGGMPAEEWAVPVNKPVWGPRYLAEQIKRKFYHRLVMVDKQVGSSMPGSGMYGEQYTGQMVADTIIPRLDAYPVAQKKTVFAGARNF